MSLRVGDWRIIGGWWDGLAPTFRRGGQAAVHFSSVLAVRGCRHLPEDPAAVEEGLGP
jgi:hypothetical protein